MSDSNMNIRCLDLSFSRISALRSINPRGNWLIIFLPSTASKLHSEPHRHNAPNHSVQSSPSGVSADKWTTNISSQAIQPKEEHRKVRASWPRHSPSTSDSELYSFKRVSSPHSGETTGGICRQLYLSIVGISIWKRMKTESNPWKRE